VCRGFRTPCIDPGVERPLMRSKQRHGAISSTPKPTSTAGEGVRLLGLHLFTASDATLTRASRCTATLQKVLSMHNNNDAASLAELKEANRELAESIGKRRALVQEWRERLAADGEASFLSVIESRTGMNRDS
jgi:CelD/BcsL family acetyltransferase involved in cellulose biosynthesis